MHTSSTPLDVHPSPRRSLRLTCVADFVRSVSRAASSPALPPMPEPLPHSASRIKKALLDAGLRGLSHARRESSSPSGRGRTSSWTPACGCAWQAEHARGPHRPPRPEGRFPERGRATSSSACARSAAPALSDGFAEVATAVTPVADPATPSGRSTPSTRSPSRSAPTRSTTPCVELKFALGAREARLSAGPGQLPGRVTTGRLARSPVIERAPLHARRLPTARPVERHLRRRHRRDHLRVRHHLPPASAVEDGLAERVVRRPRTRPLHRPEGLQLRVPHAHAVAEPGAARGR